MTTGTAGSRPLATPARLLGADRPRPGEPLWIVHGVGVDDQLVGADLRPRTVDEVMWELLHAAGYERIVFSEYREPVYFLDEGSRALTRRNHTQGEEGRRREMRRFSGPMGKRMVLEPPRTAPRATERPTRTTDPQRLQMIDALMSRRDVRTAVVVHSVERLLTHVEPSMRRAFAEALARWGTGKGAGLCTCVLLFTLAAFDEVVEFLRSLPYLPGMADRVARLGARQSAGVVTSLGLPTEAELGDLVQFTRLRHGLRIADWIEVGHLPRLMAAQGLPARTWAAALREFAASGRELSAELLRTEQLATLEVPAPDDVWRALDDMVGLTEVKQFLDAHRHTLLADAALRAAGGRGAGDPASMHLVFTGNPGTGKTVVARAIGGLYRELGLLAEGHLVEAPVDELVSQYVGETPRLVAAKVTEALDGVLFIDEAYRLVDDQNGFGRQAIEALLTAMEDHRDRLVVIVAGYPDRMVGFLAANPGLPSRFPQANRLHFPDFTPTELHRIVLRRLTDEGVPCAPELVDALRLVTEALHRTRDEDFGNARTMRELADEVKRRWATRTRPSPGAPLAEATTEDVPQAHQPLLLGTMSADDVLAELDALVGLADVKNTVRDLVSMLEVRALRARRATAAPHLLFVGAPGTGKTTVAGLMGRVFAALGLLRRGHVVTATRADLVGEHVGQTAPRTRAKVREALDGVLLIDEAYDLVRGGPTDFGREAITELIVQMEQWRGRLVVIAAGYPEPMRELIDSNDGLRSRFTEQVHFPDYDEPALRTIFEQAAAAEGLTLGDGVSERAGAWLTARRAADGIRFGNARTVRELIGLVERRQAVRVRALPAAERAAHSTGLVAADVPEPGER